jgi:diadenosine tetraphosphate (Ap4A) HIT family hydrolase
MAADNCIFCKIISGQIPCLKLLETPKVLAFLDINPLSTAHALVIPKTHSARLHEISEEEAAECGLILSKLAKALVKSGLGVDYNVLQNNGRLAHQEVEHVHFHLIPKNASEGLGIQWHSKSKSKEELAATKEKLAKFL